MNFFSRLCRSGGNFAALLVLGAILGACAMSGGNITMPEKEPSHWLGPPAESPRGVVLLVHGLNNKPEIMLPLAEELRKAGYQCLLVRLSGHRGDEWKRVDYASAWVEDVKNAAKLAHTRFPALPLTVAGYSLGAPITLAALSGDSPPPIDRAVFFAPAIERTFKAKLTNLFLPLRFFGVKLPSLAPKKWRQHDSTSLYAYEGLSDLIERIRPDKIRETPLCFILDPKDKLISFEKTGRWTSDNNLSHTRIVPNEASGIDEQNHFLVDPEARGKKPWGQMIDQIKDCLN